MKTERYAVKFLLWLKKVDASLSNKLNTPSPNGWQSVWVRGIWTEFFKEKP